jgi:hypothetical protein
MEPLSWFSSPGPVPVVDPADLKKVWDIFAKSEAQKAHSGVSGAVGIDRILFEAACRPGADVTAVWYRASMLELLCKVNNQVSHRVHGAKPDERVLTVAASFPMEKMQEGLSHVFPFDVQEFLKQIEADPGK